MTSTLNLGIRNGIRRRCRGRNQQKRSNVTMIVQYNSRKAKETNVTSSPGAESAMTISGLEFSFSSPVPENLRHDSSQDTSMILSDKKEQNKQDDLSNLEFQGKEEEVKESNDNIADPLG